MDDLHDNQAVVGVFLVLVLGLGGEEGLILCAIQFQGGHKFQGQLFTIL